MNDQQRNKISEDLSYQIIEMFNMMGNETDTELETLGIALRSIALTLSSMIATQKKYSDLEFSILAEEVSIHVAIIYRSMMDKYKTGNHSCPECDKESSQLKSPKHQQTCH